MPSLESTADTTADTLAAGFIHGHCYRVAQTQLVFGANRRPSVPYRPVLSLTSPRATHYPLVLPLTTQPNVAFRHLPAGTCLHKRRRAEKDAYICHRFEVVTASETCEIGILPHGERIAILAWLRQRWGV